MEEVGHRAHVLGCPTLPWLSPTLLSTAPFSSLPCPSCWDGLKFPQALTKGNPLFALLFCWEPTTEESRLKLPFHMLSQINSGSHCYWDENQWHQAHRKYYFQINNNNLGGDLNSKSSNSPTFFLTLIPLSDSPVDKSVGHFPGCQLVRKEPASMGGVTPRQVLVGDRRKQAMKSKSVRSVLPWTSASVLIYPLTCPGFPLGVLKP